MTKGEILKARRIELGLSYSQLSDKINMEVESIAAVEANAIEPTQSTWDRMCELLIMDEYKLPERSAWDEINAYRGPINYEHMCQSYSVFAMKYADELKRIPAKENK